MIRIGIVGDFNAKFHTHIAINAAIQHSAADLDGSVQADWVATPHLAASAADRLLSNYDALWAAPVSPYQSAEGMLHAIAFARTRNVPFTGT